jgi:mannan endo-1,4-beta-mannosidase
MVAVDGTQFVVDCGRTIFFSGFNAYWLMMMAADPALRGAVATAFQQASAHGLNLARTWAFSDGGDQPLQSSPGVYNETMFQVILACLPSSSSKPTQKLTGCLLCNVFLGRGWTL